MRGFTKTFGLIFLAFTTFLPATQGDFTPIAGWDNQLFPSYLIATATLKPDANADVGNTLGDPDGQLGVIVTATDDDQEITVTVRCDEFMEVSEFHGVLPESGKTYAVVPKARFRFDRLSQCRQATPATIIYTVKLGEEKTEEISKTVTFRSVNDCPLLVKTPTATVDTTFAFAAYVNEQHPFVDKLLREALDRGVVDKFDGYQSGKPENVIQQVYALWDLLAARDVRYSSITTTAADSESVCSQHVRMIEETANNSQANCVDGSVLLVSMLRKIGIHAALVLQPGHCYVAFAGDAKGESTFGIETTLIAAEVAEPEELDEFLDDSVEEDLRDEASWPSFIQAIQIGTTELVKNKDKFESSTEHDYAVIDVRSWRTRGVLPIPFSSKEEFVSYDFTATEVEAAESDETDRAESSPEEGETDKEETDDDEA